MYILLFILLLFLIVVIHEFGHLIAAKLFGVYCSEFSFGMGPKLFSIKGKETLYSVRLFPVGGFVSMAGEPDDKLESNTDPNLDIPFERTINGVSPIKKIIIMYAGIIMNFILGIVIFSLIIFSNGGIYSGTNTVIADISENTPAYNSGLMIGDKIVSINIDDTNHKADTYDLLSYALSLYDGNGDIEITVIRNDETLNYSLMPQYIAEENRYLMGVSFSRGDFIETNIFTAFKYGFKHSLEVATLVFAALANLLRGIGLDSLSGPIGIFETTKDVVAMGFGAYLELIAILSLNVGIMNALPIPVMDGGRVLIEIIQLIIRKPLNKKVENIIMTGSVILLLLLFVLVTFNDIIKLI